MDTINGHPTLKAGMLGGFTLSTGPHQERAVSSASHSRKVWLLLAYLICFRVRSVPRDELFSLLWPQGMKRPGNLANALKTISFRARDLLEGLWPGAGHDLLLSREGSYAWNTQIPLDLDVERFLELCRSRNDPDRLLEAARMYSGGFLPKLRGSSPWVDETAGRLESAYITAVRRAMPMLEEAGRMEELCGLCAGAASVMPLDEELYRRWLSSMLALGREHEAVKAYEEMSQLSLSITGSLPSGEIQNLYRQAMSASGAPAISAVELLAQLDEGPAEGAYFCQYDVFRALYRLQVRDSTRSGESLCLGLLALCPREGAEIARRSLDLAMDNLERLIPPLLRTGDAVAKCSASQYVLLLPRAEPGSGRLVCQRIARAFGRQYPHSQASVQVTVWPVNTGNRAG